LSSGVLFQSRFVLASLSTHDHHLDLQVRSFLANDVGLGIGALLPAVSAILSRSCPAYALDLLPSAVLAMLSLGFLVWVLVAFPRRVHRLPDRVRFPPPDLRKPSEGGPGGGTHMESLDHCRKRLLLSGTTRVFVQSGAMLAVALCMRDAGFTGNFRQTKVVAALCLLQVPFEALASGICCDRKWTSPWKRQRRRRLAFGSLATILLMLFCTRALLLSTEHRVTKAALTACEMGVLLVALAIATPDSVSRLNGLPDAERSMVLVEWLKAYIGRLIGFVFALVVLSYVGYVPLLAALSVATALVVFTA